MAEERDVRFVTEESFDFGFLSPSDSLEEEEDEEGAGGPGGSSGRWAPLSGAHLEEMMREATLLAAQLERCQLPPRGPSDARSPRSPRRQTFVVKDSPVRALLPTVETQGPSPPKPRASPAATSGPGTHRVSSSRHPTAAPKGPPGAKGPPPSRVGPSRPCPPQGQGARSRGGKLELPHGGAAGQLKARGAAAPCPPPQPPAPCQGRQCPPQPPPGPQRHPSGTHPDPGGGHSTQGGLSTQGEGPCSQRHSPRCCWLQTRPPPEPPAPPPEASGQQHPEVTPQHPEGHPDPHPPPAGRGEVGALGKLRHGEGKDAGWILL
ncbi:proline/serine-rich coiled-coil protein 1 [Colius striatus]|uniref:proline/serine-rich coiled-coil protein 1 n=1 Tax=Colius striatus TaxID=57412 RepID=UPI002B1DE77D|nr:proline/serine-rich coiled-coil protein 1 [Colius striatus]